MTSTTDESPRLRVLLVEDSPGDAALVGEMLREADMPPFDLSHFEQLSQAREFMTRHGADCILLDLSLPDADGLSGLLYMLSSAGDIPVVVLTGSDDEAMAFRALEEGAQDYLIKGRADQETIARAVRYAIERKRAEVELTHQAFHDSLTGLPNRALFHDRMQIALTRLARRSDSLATLFLDLDNFKYVNDSLGHGAGDDLLIKVGERLGAAVRPSDSVARFGGDEFVLLCEELTGTEEAMTIAGRLMEALARPIVVSHQEILVTASIGIALTDNALTSPGELVRDADAAMYRAKRDGKARAVIFERDQHRDASERLALEASLNHAVEREEFWLAWQPIYDLDTGNMAGVESLLRWRHPTRGNLAPGLFLQVAEEKGLIVPIGHWVLTEVLKQAKRWHDDFGDDAPIATINLSVRQLRDHELPNRIAEELMAVDLPPERICIEVTEQALLSSDAVADRALKRFDEIGLHVAIDDFGMGHSSLHTVKQAPIDCLKIDRSFVASLGQDSQDYAICRAVLALGSDLGLEVVAEGIESEVQLEQLGGLGCRLGQGFHLGLPVPIEELDPRATLPTTRSQGA